MTAAGPASEEAYRAPNSQPAPMIDPNGREQEPEASRYRAAAFAPRAREQPPTVEPVRPSIDPFQCGRPEIYSGRPRRHRSRTCLASGYDAVLVLKTNWGTGPSRSARDSN